MLWTGVIILALILSIVPLPLYYSFHEVNYYDITFDGEPIVFDRWPCLKIVNETVNASLVHTFNITVQKITVPEKILPDEPFVVSFILKEEFDAPVNHTISVGVDTGIPEEANINPFWDVGYTSMQITGLTNITVNCTSIRDLHLFYKNEVRFEKPPIHSGINLFELSIWVDDYEYRWEFCSTLFTIEILPDSDVILLSNIAATATIATGAVITIAWIWRGRKTGNKGTDTTGSEPGEGPLETVVND